MNDPKNQFENPFADNRSRLSQTSENCTNSSYNDLQFRPNFNHQQENDDSGVCSPPLWKSPPRSPSQPLLNHHRSLSPNSRIQAITKGQRELMEMVKNMPESSYELSLRDLVEKQGIETQTPQLKDRKRVVVKVKRQESKRRIESFENKRVFLKMVIPFSLKSKKKGTNSSGRVSPKPETEWWKKKFSGSTDSDRSNNSNDGARRLNGLLTGCWPFLQSRKSKSVE